MTPSAPHVREAAPNLPPGFDFTDPDIYATRLPTEEFAEVRRAAPIWWNEQPPDVGGFGDGGFWVVSKHRDVREVSLRSDVFSSQKKSIVPRYKVTGGGGQIEAGAAVDDHDGRPRAQPAAQDHLPRVHAARRRAAARRAQRAGPAHRRAGRRRALRRLRPPGRPRAAAAGHRRAPRGAAGGPRQALRLDQPDDRQATTTPSSPNTTRCSRPPS